MPAKRTTLRRKPDAKAVAERGVHGEGSYEGTRDYNAATRRFVKSGRVEGAARAAAPRDPAEAKAIEQAEQDGARRARGEDPQVAGDPARPRGKRSQ